MADFYDCREDAEMLLTTDYGQCASENKRRPLTSIPANHETDTIDSGWVGDAPESEEGPPVDDRLRLIVVKTGQSARTVIAALEPRLLALCAACSGGGIGSTPHDIGDLGRCIEALRELGEKDEQSAVTRVAKTYRGWTPIAERWRELRAAFDCNDRSAVRDLLAETESYGEHAPDLVPRDRRLKRENAIADTIADAIVVATEARRCFGNVAQDWMLIEECGELMTALARRGTEAQVDEEIADVLLVALGAISGDVLRHLAAKVKRLEGMVCATARAASPETGDRQ